MNETALNTGLDCQAITDLLMHRFELQPGNELVPILGLGGESSSREALAGWVSRRVDFYQERGVDRPLLYLEAELAAALLASPLKGGELSEDICTAMPDLPAPASTSRLKLIRGGRGKEKCSTHNPELALMPALTDENEGE